MTTLRLTAATALLVAAVACGGSDAQPGESPAATTTGAAAADATPDATTSPKPPAPAPTESTTPAPTPTAAAPSTSATTPGARTAPPSRVVVNAGAELQVRSVDSGAVVAVPRVFDDPADHGGDDGEPVAAGEFLDDVRRDGTTIIYTTCCEPAAGTVHEVQPTGRGGAKVADGDEPALGPDGRLAVVHLQSVRIIRSPRGDGDVRRFDAEQPPGQLRHLTLSPEGDTLAGVWRDPGEGGLARPEIFVLDLEDADSLDDVRRLTPSDAALGWTAPAFRADGSLVVAEQPHETSSGPARGLVLDPADGDVQASFPLAGPVFSQRYDASGRYLLTTYEDGRLAWQGFGGSGRIADSGINDAAW